MAATLCPELTELLRRGAVIPAHPLALTAQRRLDERSQRALTRYYRAAGAGGVAVGVHTTQFAIHDPKCGLLEPVLRATVDALPDGRDPFLLVAGVCGPTDQAVREAALAAALGYHAVLLSPNATCDLTEKDLLTRARDVGDVLPVIGFYLQPAAGGRLLSQEYWRAFADLESVVAVKLAPFDRYQTLAAIRGICGSQRGADISLYTGNDDSIISDLLSDFQFGTAGLFEQRHFSGGLLGQWAVGTHAAVGLLARIKQARAGDGELLREVVGQAASLTDANGAIFDAAHRFAGCVPGINEVLHRQGLLAGSWCLDPAEVLSPGQAAELDRVSAAYPWLTDDDFVSQHLDEWLA